MFNGSNVLLSLSVFSTAQHEQFYLEYYKKVDCQLDTEFFFSFGRQLSAFPT